MIWLKIIPIKLNSYMYTILLMHGLTGAPDVQRTTGHLSCPYSTAPAIFPPRHVPQAGSPATAVANREYG